MTRTTTLTVRLNETLSLVTGDKDLLALSDHFTSISPAEFCARHTP